METLVNELAELTRLLMSGSRPKTFAGEPVGLAAFPVGMLVVTMDLFHEEAEDASSMPPELSTRSGYGGCNLVLGRSTITLCRTRSHGSARDASFATRLRISTTPSSPHLAKALSDTRGKSTRSWIVQSPAGLSVNHRPKACQLVSSARARERSCCRQ